MALLSMPVDAGGVLVVEVDAPPGTDDSLGLASTDGLTSRATVSLENALDQLEPTITALQQRLRRAAPDELHVEFGLKLGGETGVIVAKGTVEVNFLVSMTWRSS
jgi:Trypsin-co-occurring domain 1